ncbi:MAG: hypothetical protein NVSMB62_00170 [Acidobacteriaceae bacterium]
MSTMAGESPNRPTAATWRVLLALLCVLLVAVSGVTLVIHMHTDGMDTHANCSMCASAHTSVHIVQTPAPPQAFLVTALVEVRKHEHLATPYFAFALFNRPPPAA